MSIPLYYALNWKESVNFSATYKAQLDFGFTVDGALNVPRELLPHAPAVVNDAILPRRLPDESVLEQLSQYCRSGCIFDFERVCTPMHRAVLRSMKKYLCGVPLFAIPERFFGVVSEAQTIVLQASPCNNWEAFCALQRRKYGSNWILELVPWNETVTAPISYGCNGILDQSPCSFTQKDRILTYRDTETSLKKKLKIAQSYGCIAAIGLYNELIKI